MPRKRVTKATALKTRRRLASPAKAVMRAFRSAKFSAPMFMSAYGIFPEVSESASDHLHPIVHDLAVRQLNKGRHLRELQKGLRQLAAGAQRGRETQQEVLERIGTELTAVLAAEATAAYLFGLSVGLTVRSLPEQLEP
jgi:hypothetical protein